MVREGLFRAVGACILAAFLVVAEIEAPSAYAATGLALAYGGLIVVGRPVKIFRNGFVGVVVDSVVVSIIVAGTGGAASAFFPLYLLAALGISRAPGNRSVVAGTLALMIGYTIAAGVAGRDLDALLGPGFLARAVLIALCCALAGVLAARLRGARRRAEVLASALEAERTYHEGLTATISALAPVLSSMDRESLLGWVASAAREATGAAYAHVATIDGRHQTAAQGDLDAYPSWWHPTIQRLVLHGTRTAMVQRTDENIHGVDSFLAVPLAAYDNAGLGAIVVGGGSFGATEERVLALLAARVVPALEATGDAPGGRDALTGLPNHTSLYRVLQRRLAYEGALTVLAVRLDRLERGPEGSVLGEDKILVEALGEELTRAYRWVFGVGEGSFVLLLGGVNRVRIRKTALGIRRLAERLASERALPSTASVGFSVTSGTAAVEPSALVEAALDALSVAGERADRIAGSSLGGEDSGGIERGQISTRAEVARALVAAAEIHSPPLGDHLRGVSRLAHLVGREMGLAEDRLDSLVAGALLHDVGKIGISDSILHKPGSLNEEETQAMRRHPTMGAELVGMIEGLSDTLPAIKHHHERFDGLGYPDGLKGEEIPLEARIVLVADAFESMTRGRPYRFKLSTGEALQELSSHAGAQFDLKVVQALVAVLETDSRLSDSAS